MIDILPSTRRTVGVDALVPLQVAHKLFVFAAQNGGSDIEMIQYEERGPVSVWFDLPVDALNAMMRAASGVQVRDNRRKLKAPHG